MIRALSLGWGVQSWTLAAMVALGELPMLDAAVFGDTAHERAATYAFAAEWSPWLEARGVKVVRVQQDGAGGTKVVHNGAVTIPAFTFKGDGSKGRIRRQCTGDWKIRPVRKWLRSVRNNGAVELWLGISKDEFHRAKDADVKYLQHRFPLLELGMSRADCLAWLAAHDLPSPGKSTCVFCPFQNKAAWEEMRQGDGDDWREAVRVDAEIRDARLPGQLFVHQRRVPLVDAVDVVEGRATQLQLLGSDDADAECDSGFCFL